jgi:glycosyltransferase involved in cell wall biosynthesis
MKVTIIVPVYNVEKYLERCLCSIVNQTYANLEIILINDGSKDNSLAICNHYKIFDSRIILINQSNKGIAKTRNIGIESATGDYITFVDSDDEIELNMLEDYVTFLKTYFPDVVCTNMFNYTINNINYSIIKNTIPNSVVLNKSDIKKYFIQPYFEGNLGIIPSTVNKLYKRSFLLDNKLVFNVDLKKAEDYWFNFYVFKLSEIVFYIDKAYYHYYTNQGSIMRTFREDEFDLIIDSRIQLLNENKTLNCIINWQGLNEEFINNCNELILMAFVNKRADIVKKILKNPEFLVAFKSINPNRPHTKLIKKLLLFKFRRIAYIIYRIWSRKIIIKIT